MKKSKEDEDDEGYDVGDLAAGMLIAATAAAIGVAAVLLPQRRRDRSSPPLAPEPTSPGRSIEVADLELEANDVPHVGRDIN